jgi:hypothetical protein
MLTLGPLDVRVRWRESRAIGGVTVTGTVSDPAELMLSLTSRGASGEVLAHLVLAVPSAGAFSGTLPFPSTLLPGRYLLHVGGTSGGEEVPAVHGDFGVAAPEEGVVDRAFVSATRGGPPALTLSGPVHELWARFRFAARPRAPLVTILWIGPSGRIVAGVIKPYARTVESFIESARPVQRGTWQAVLKVERKAVKRVFVRIR